MRTFNFRPLVGKFLLGCFEIRLGCVSKGLVWFAEVLRHGTMFADRAVIGDSRVAFNLSILTNDNG